MAEVVGYFGRTSDDNARRQAIADVLRRVADQLTSGDPLFPIPATITITVAISGDDYNATADVREAA